MWPNPQENADLVAFTQEIINEKLHFFAQWFKNCSKETLLDIIEGKIAAGSSVRKTNPHQYT